MLHRLVAMRGLMAMGLAATVGAWTTSTCAPRAAAHSPTSPTGASGCCWTTSRRSGYPFTRKAPRMNGWIRQK